MSTARTRYWGLTRTSCQVGTPYCIHDVEVTHRMGAASSHRRFKVLRVQKETELLYDQRYPKRPRCILPSSALPADLQMLIWHYLLDCEGSRVVVEYVGLWRRKWTQQDIVDAMRAIWESEHVLRVTPGATVLIAGLRTQYRGTPDWWPVECQYVPPDGC